MNRKNLQTVKMYAKLPGVRRSPTCNRSVSRFIDCDDTLYNRAMICAKPASSREFSHLPPPPHAENQLVTIRLRFALRRQLRRTGVFNLKPRRSISLAAAMTLDEKSGRDKCAMSLMLYIHHTLSVHVQIFTSNIQYPIINNYYVVSGRKL